MPRVGTGAAAAAANRRRNKAAEMDRQVRRLARERRRSSDGDNDGDADGDDQQQDLKSSSASSSATATELRLRSSVRSDGVFFDAAADEDAANAIAASAAGGTSDQQSSPPFAADENVKVDEDATDGDPSTLRSRSLKSLHDLRTRSGEIVNDERVQLVIVGLIAINAIMMGIATFDFVKDDPGVDRAFETVDLVFLIVFTVELGMQFVYRGLYLFTDGWLVFDFVVVMMSWVFADLQIIRAFRIFRALRLITRVKVMRNLVVALLSVMPRMGAIGLLLFLIFYIFGVMYTTLFKDMWHDGDTEVDYFSRLDSSFFTLFQIMTLDNWAEVARDVMRTYKWAWLPFVAFVVITGFIVVNLIIAVICDAIAALHDDDRAKLHGDEVESSSDDGRHETLDGVRGDAKGHPAPPQDRPTAGGVTVERKIGELESQVEEFTRLQEQTMHTIEFLMRHIHVKQMEQPGVGTES